MMLIHALVFEQRNMEDVRNVLGHHTLCVTLNQSPRAKILETESLAHCDCGT